MKRRFQVVALALSVLAGACTDGSLQLTEEAKRQVAEAGWGATARVDLSVDDWVDIAQRACDGSPWEEEDQAAIVEEFQLARNVPVDQAMFGVFILAVAACRERFPPEIVGE